MSHFGDSRAPDGPGIFPLQDYSTGKPELNKYNIVGVSVTGRDDRYGDFHYDGAKVGAIRQAIHWARNDGAMGWYSWIYTVGVRGTSARDTAREGANNSGSLRVQPRRSTTLFSDKLGERTAGIPASWPKIPGNFLGAVAAYASENSEQIAYHHTDPRIVSANRGDIETGSIVGDVTGSDFDADVTARLQSLTRVLKKPSNAPGNTLGIHMGFSAQGDTRGGYLIDRAMARKTRGPTSGGGGSGGGNFRGTTITPSGRETFDGGGRLSFEDLVPTYSDARGGRTFNRHTGYNPQNRRVSSASSSAATRASASMGRSNYILTPQRYIGGSSPLGFGTNSTGGKSGSVVSFGVNHKTGNTLVREKREGSEISASGGAIGMMSALDGGIISNGLNNDPHRIGFDGDGNPINPTHLTTRALWINPRATNEDGPMRFEFYRAGNDQSILSAVHLGWTGTDFAWWTTSALDEPRPPPGDPTPPNDPRKPPPVKQPDPPEGPTTDPRFRGQGHLGRPPTPLPGPIRPPGGVGGAGGGAPGGGHGAGASRGASSAIQTHAATGGSMPRPFGSTLGGSRAAPGTFDRVYDPATPGWAIVGARDIMAPAFSFMARFIAEGRRNSNYDFNRLNTAEIEDLYDTSPVTGHFESFAKQRTGGFDYNQLPLSRSGKSRWRGGTADGGSIFLPPELDMGAAVNDQWAGLVAGGGISTATLVLGPNTCLGFGEPDLATGGVTGTKMCHDPDGVVTITPPVGGSFPLDWGLRVLFAGTVDADTTTVSTGALALSGDEFRSLKITGHWNGGAGDGRHLYVFFNGDTGTKVQITPTSWDIADDFESFELTLRPKSGVQRAIDMVTNIRYDGDGTFLSSRVSEIEVWLNSADEITEIGLNTDDPNGIGAGSQFEVTGVRFL